MSNTADKLRKDRKLTIGCNNMAALGSLGKGDFSRILG